MTRTNTYFNTFNTNLDILMSNKLVDINKKPVSLNLIVDVMRYKNGFVLNCRKVSNNSIKKILDDAFKEIDAGAKDDVLRIAFKQLKGDGLCLNKRDQDIMNFLVLVNRLVELPNNKVSVCDFYVRNKGIVTTICG